MKTKKILALIMACLMLVTAFAACNTGTNETDDPSSTQNTSEANSTDDTTVETAGKLESILNKKELVIYTDPNFAPFEFLDDGDNIIGVDIEIAKAIAQELGVTLKIEEGVFDSIILGLKQGRGDIAVSGFTILEDRKENVDFSDTYITSYQYLIVPEGSEIAVMEDLSGKKIAVAFNYSGSFLMDDEISGGVLKDTGAEMKEADSAVDALLELKNGKVDAVVIDELVAKSLVSKYEGFEAKELSYKDGKLEPEEFGVAIPKGNADLVEKINQVIKKLKDEKKIDEWVVEYADKASK